MIFQKVDIRWDIKEDGTVLSIRKIPGKGDVPTTQRRDTE
jgi:hypothetical protein